MLKHQRQEVPTKGLEPMSLPCPCTPVSQHGVEEGGMDCGGRGGHQTPGPNMEGMDGGGAG